jgi:two-component system chemotaxis response regulator CheV
MKPPLMGMVNIRDQVIPVIDLAAVAGCKPETGLNILLITEYARSVQAFAVESVENIMRLDWKQVHAAETAVSGRTSPVLPVWTKTKTNDLAMVLDVEQILYDITPADHDLHATNLPDHQIQHQARCCRDCGGRFQSGALDAGERSAGDGDPGTLHITGKDAWERIGCSASRRRLKVCRSPIRSPWC